MLIGEHCPWLFSVNWQKKSREINPNGPVSHFLFPILPQNLFCVLIDKQILQLEIKSSLTVDHQEFLEICWIFLNIPKCPRYHSWCDKLIISYLKDFGTTNKTLLLKLIFSTLSSIKINVKFFLNSFLA